MLTFLDSVPSIEGGPPYPADAQAGLVGKAHARMRQLAMEGSRAAPPWSGQSCLGRAPSELLNNGWG